MNNLKKKFFFKTILIFLPVCVFLALPVFSEEEGSIDLEFSSEKYTLERNDSGYDIIKMDGFSSSSSAGNPALPNKVFNIVVPPDIDWESLKLNGSSEFSVGKSRHI